MIREAHVAGSWYPGTKAALEEWLREHVKVSDAPQKAVAALVPHAGYVYSGDCAGLTYGRLAVPGRVLLLAVNHRGGGPRYSLWPGGHWRVPTGLAPIDEGLNAALRVRFDALVEDTRAHAAEHSAELQVPFIRWRNPDARLSVVSISAWDLKELQELGSACADAVSSLPGETLIVASSDLNHYESQAVSNRKDRLAIDALLALDEAELHRRVRDEDISMCGHAPAVATVTAAKRLGAKRAELVDYRTSGDVSGDYDRVVGYAGILFLA